MCFEPNSGYFSQGEKMEISTWPVFFPVMNLQETLSSAPFPGRRVAEAVQAVVSLNFLWQQQQQQRIPGPTR